MRAVVGMGTCGLAAGAASVHQAVETWLGDHQPDVALSPVGCIGLCYREVVIGLPHADGTQLYGDIAAADVPALLRAHFDGHEIDPSKLISLNGSGSADASFVRRDERVVLKRCGVVDPSSIREYLATGGYRTLESAVARGDGRHVIEAVTEAGLRGRGGAGFPTGRKWTLARAAAGEPKVLICNADEGDPGAFMDRSLLEGDPFAVLEGMALGALAIGASEGIVYVRNEYPLAVKRLEAAIEQARSHGFLGRRVAGGDFGFDVRIVRGAGAFVCGEETAMIAAIEGRRGIPRPRPPYPVERGLRGQPTCINNVETLANVPLIVGKGAAHWRRIGMGDSRGTKVFSLAGDIRRGGLVEVPMGTTIRSLVDEIGGGSSTDRPIKAVQLGGPSGGCLPAELFDTPISYEALSETGAIMGSGGIVVLDDSRCMVDVARYFLSFTQQQSCGRCTFCRVGTRRLLELLERLCEGRGKRGDIETIERLSQQVGAASLCGLGKTAPNPILTTLRYFRDEYEAHLKGRCPSGRCRELIRYRIDPWVCDACQRCLTQCPAGTISLEDGILGLNIDTEACARCGGCMDVCAFGAVTIGAREGY